MTRCPPCAAREPTDQGSAVVDFVLVMMILVPLFLGIIQLGLVLHVRNTLVAAARSNRYRVPWLAASLSESVAAPRSLTAYQWSR